MSSLTVVRRPPRVVIGVCSVHPDQQFEEFEDALDWLEVQGVPVERLEPTTIGPLLEHAPEVARVWHQAGADALPLIVAGNAVLSSGRTLSKHQLAHLVGPYVSACSLDALMHVVDLATATAVGSDTDRARERASAEHAGMEGARLDSIEHEARRVADHLVARR